MAKRIQLPDGSIGEFPDDMPDEEIASVLTEQFPPTQNAQQAAPEAPQAPQTRDWGDVPAAALRNAPRSAANFAGDVWNAVTSPVQTAKGMLDLGAGALRAGAGKVAPSLMNYIDRFDNPETTQRLDQTAEGAGQFLKNRYGSEAALRETIGTDPVGALGDLSTLLTGGATLAPKAGMVANTMAKAARFTDPINLAAQGASKGLGALGSGAANLAGNMSGAGGEALKIAYQSGKEGGEAGRQFRTHMRDTTEGAGIVDTAKAGLEKMHKDLSDAYVADRQVWAASNPSISLTHAPIDAAYTKLVADSTGPGGFKTLGKKDQKILTEIGDKIAEWKTTNPNPDVLAYDALKRSIRNINVNPLKHTHASRLIGAIESAAKREIQSVSPEYAKAMKDYETKIGQIKEVTKSLSLGSKATADTALRKLSSVTRNNVNTNYGQRGQLLDMLETEGGVSLKPAIGGTALNSIVPRGIQSATALPGTALLSGLVHPAFLAALAAESPRVSGEIAHKMGQAARWPSRAASAASPVTSSALRAGTPMQSLSDLYTEDEALMELKRRRK